MCETKWHWIGASATSLHHANETLWVLSGTDRIRLPVAAKNALSTAGAAPKIVGSPTPPQNPPGGMVIGFALGISPIGIHVLGSVVVCSMPPSFTVDSPYNKSGRP